MMLQPWFPHPPSGGCLELIESDLPATRAGGRMIVSENLQGSNSARLDAVAVALWLVPNNRQIYSEE